MNKVALLVLASALSALNLKAQVQSVVVHLNKQAALTLERTPFKAAGKTLKFHKSEPQNVGKPKLLMSINGKTFFGTDGEVPKYTLTKAILLLNGITYHLRVDNMYNPWFGAGPNEQLISLKKTDDSYRLTAELADGAGTYMAVWKISGKTSTRIVLTADEDPIVKYEQSLKY